MNVLNHDFKSEQIAHQLFDEIAHFSKDGQGVSRPAFSCMETKTLKYLEDYAKSQGLCVSYDAGKNAIFSLPHDQDAARYILIGSHVDSVPNGGNFDGLAGVIAGILCLVRAQKSGVRFGKAVKVIAMRGEESAWFGPCYMGSKALLGVLGDDELNAVHKGDGRPLSAHMSDIGVNMNRVRQNMPLLDPDEIDSYIELHIEQGPLLSGKQLPVAVVSGIRGNVRHKLIQCIGEAGHSGAVPRAYRRDPVFAVAELLTRLDESWLAILERGDDLVMTSGVVATDPHKHGLTRIADQISFSLDFRSQDEDALQKIHDFLLEEIHSVEAKRGVRFELDHALYTAPALCDAKMVEGFKNAMTLCGFEPFVMPSGGGHDAAVFANFGIPSTMVFVRNENGSHNPDEAMDVADLVCGSNVIFRYLTQINS